MTTAEILSVGTELLLGQIANTNAQWMSERLAEIGVDVLHHQTVGDNEERIAEAFRLALSRADVVLATGGLGPTQDDVTREGLVAALGVDLEPQPAIEDWLRDRFAQLGREMPQSNLRQALVPAGGRYITPQRGTAPGLICRHEGRTVYVVPGVPVEMKEMLEATILPELAAMAGPATITSRILKVTGVAESRLAEILDDLFHGSTNPTVAYLASSGEVKVRLTAKAASRGQADALIEPLAEEVHRRLGERVFSTDDEQLEHVVGRLLKARQRTVACAESLTGGSLAARLTASPGSSAFFLGSAVCYSPESKERVLGVSRETIDGPGVVSEDGLVAGAPEPERPLRLFVAADLPPEILEVVAERCEAWRRRLGDGVGRWVPVENQHVTVAFLGRAWPHQVEWVQTRVRRATARIRPFDSGLAAYGVVPSRSRARVLWLGLEERGRGWDALAAAVRGAVAEAFPPQARPFTPHLTLARFEPRISFAAHHEALAEPVGAPSFRVGSVALYRSHLGGPRARYEELVRFRLRG
ncbi:MAG: competence/damage-inducible protein A [Actinobacteria bacterium]|nr:competence/damage-inducible protein A [Actinomycetota bacterium]